MTSRDPTNPIWQVQRALRAELKTRDLEELCDSELWEMVELLEHWHALAKAKKATREAARRAPAPSTGGGDG
jgi:hypothetical protein